VLQVYRTVRSAYAGLYDFRRYSVPLMRLRRDLARRGNINTTVDPHDEMYRVRRTCLGLGHFRAQSAYLQGGFEIVSALQRTLALVNRPLQPGMSVLEFAS